MVLLYLLSTILKVNIFRDTLLLFLWDLTAAAATGRRQVREEKNALYIKGKYFWELNNLKNLCSYCNEKSDVISITA